MEVDGYMVGVMIYWNLIGLMSVILDVDWMVQEIIVVDGVSVVIVILDSLVGICVDYEFFRNLIVLFEGGYLRWNFEGIGCMDDEYQVGVFVCYFFN